LLCSTPHPASPHLEYYFRDTGPKCDIHASNKAKVTSACGCCLAHFVCDDSYTEGHFAFDNSSCKDGSSSFIELPESMSMSDRGPTPKRRKLHQSEILQCMTMNSTMLNTNWKLTCVVTTINEINERIIEVKEIGGEVCLKDYLQLCSTYHN